MAQHVKILGVLHIILGAFGVAAALAVFAIFGGVAGFLSLHPDEVGDLAVPGIVGIVGSGITLIILILSIPGIIVGIGLVRFRPWARVAGIVMSALDLIHIPFGTIVGVYGLWTLLNAQTEALFRPGAVVAAAPYAPPPVR